MQLPLFYIREFEPGMDQLVLDEVNSKHIIQVLRKNVYDKILLTNGNGYFIECEILDNDRKKCKVRVLSVNQVPSLYPRLVMAVSLVKNPNRFEWLLEKTTEIGINEIIPLICSRTEKQRAKIERWNNILVSAMLQSRQCWLPVLHEPVQLKDLLKDKMFSIFPHKYIAHCESDQEKTDLSGIKKKGDAVMLVGPEGDFTETEIKEAIQIGYQPVSLGNTRLRTETAAIYSSVLLRSQ